MIILIISIASYTSGVGCHWSPSVGLDLSIVGASLADRCCTARARSPACSQLSEVHSGKMGPEDPKGLRHLGEGAGLTVMFVFYNMCIYIYIYTHREREREIIYIYIYIYIFVLLLLLFIFIITTNIMFFLGVGAGCWKVLKGGFLKSGLLIWHFSWFVTNIISHTCVSHK